MADDDSMSDFDKMMAEIENDEGLVVKSIIEMPDEYRQAVEAERAPSTQAPMAKVSDVKASTTTTSTTKRSPKKSSSSGLAPLGNSSGLKPLQPLSKLPGLSPVSSSKGGLAPLTKPGSSPNGLSEIGNPRGSEPSRDKPPSPKPTRVKSPSTVPIDEFVSKSTDSDTGGLIALEAESKIQAPRTPKQEAVVHHADEETVPAPMETFATDSAAAEKAAETTLEMEALRRRVAELEAQVQGRDAELKALKQSAREPVEQALALLAEFDIYNDEAALKVLMTEREHLTAEIGDYKQRMAVHGARKYADAYTQTVPTLQQLLLSSAPLDQDPHFHDEPDVTSLDLHEWDLADEGCALLSVHLRRFLRESDAALDEFDSTDRPESKSARRSVLNVDIEQLFQHWRSVSTPANHMAPTRLVLDGNRISATGACAILTAIKDCPSITHLSLRDNFIGCVPEVTHAKIPSEEEVHDSQNAISGELGSSFEVFCDLLAGNPHLRSVDLAHNCLASTAAALLLKKLTAGKSPVLTELNLTGNNLGLRGAHAVQLLVNAVPTLVKVEVQDDRIPRTGILAKITESLAKNVRHQVQGGGEYGEPSKSTHDVHRLERLRVQAHAQRVTSDLTKAELVISELNRKLSKQATAILNRDRAEHALLMQLHAKSRKLEHAALVGESYMRRRQAVMDAQDVLQTLHEYTL